MIIYTMQENDTSGVHTADSTKDKCAYKCNHVQTGDGENNLMHFKTWVAELLCVRRYCLCYKSVISLVSQWETGRRHVTLALFHISNLKKKKKHTREWSHDQGLPCKFINTSYKGSMKAWPTPLKPFASVFEEQVSKTCKDPLHWQVRKDSKQHT